MKGDESNQTTSRPKFKWKGKATSQIVPRIDWQRVKPNDESAQVQWWITPNPKWITPNSRWRTPNPRYFKHFNQSINQSIEQSINQSNNQSINRTINQSNDQSINQSITHCWDNGLRAWTHAPSFGTQQWWRTEGVDACPSFGTVRYTKILHITNYYSWEMGACPWRQPWANEFKVQLYV